MRRSDKFLENNTVLESTVKPEESGMRIDQYLSGRFTYYSRTVWKENIGQGLVRVNDAITKPAYIVKSGDKLKFRLFEKEEPNVSSDYKTIYRDDEMMVVDKPPNVPVHPAGIYRTQSLLTFLQEDLGEEFYTVNRIDRETSGLVLFGRNSAMASKLTSLFKSKSIRKKYIVYVYGSFPEKMTIKGMIGKHDSSVINKKKKVYPVDYDGNEDVVYCETEFEKILEKDGISKIFAYPVTGRQHQIRASLDSFGYQLIGDKIYGNDENRFFTFIENGYCDETIDIINRQALHSYGLSFVHPSTHEVVEIFAEEPDDMKSIISSS